MLSFLGTALTVAILTGYALGRPISTDASQRFWRLDVGKTQCFTQRAAMYVTSSSLSTRQAQVTLIPLTVPLTASSSSQTRLYRTGLTSPPPVRPRYSSHSAAEAVRCRPDHRSPPALNVYLGCVFTDTADLTTDELLSAGSTLMGCLEPANGIINGVCGFFGG
jgi:hypothetical protein